MSVCFNRTFMELKWLTKTFQVILSLVLIVPLWNWNVFLSMLNDATISCFNRTFMELKYYSRSTQGFYFIIVLIVPLWNWNTKVLEVISAQIRVLIVPLWNWNLLAYHKIVNDFCFNRTFMELKLKLNI